MEMLLTSENGRSARDSGTAPDSKSISALVEGVAPGDKLLVIERVPTARDSEDTLAFSAQTGIRAMIEQYPLEKLSRVTSG